MGTSPPTILLQDYLQEIVRGGGGGVMWAQYMTSVQPDDYDITFLTIFILTHPVNFPCGKKLMRPEKTYDFRQTVNRLFSHDSVARIEPTISEMKDACSDDYGLAPWPFPWLYYCFSKKFLKGNGNIYFIFSFERTFKTIYNTLLPFFISCLLLQIF